MPKKVVEKTQEVKKMSRKKTEAVNTEVAVENKVSTKAVKSVSLPVYSVDGKEAGTVVVPGEIFNAKVNPVLMAQAVRVFLVNQRQGTSSTKTRGEVAGSTRKIYRQKGTGRARHGGVRAPIFVHGGIAFGPKPRDFDLKLPEKMKRKALFSALTSKLQEKKILVADGEDKLKGKTKETLSMLSALNLLNKQKKGNKILFVVPADADAVKKAARNIEGVTLIPAQNLNTYQVLNSNHIVFLKNTIDTLASTFLKS